MPERELIFPLVPTRRSARLDVAGHTSRRRGGGSELASSRPYRRGDAVRHVDWRASARLSSARASDEFVVRDRFADDTVRVVIVVDRSPSMALFPEELPWLHKPAVVRTAGGMILASASASSALVGYAELGPAGLVFEHPRRDRALAHHIGRRLAAAAGDGPEAGLDETLDLLTRSTADVPPGTLVFVLSDFLRSPRRSAWRRLVAGGWDVVPVVIQDPCWEQSFPDVAGVTLPLADAASGAIRYTRLTRAEAYRLRTANERRLRALSDAFLLLGVDPVSLPQADPRSVHGAFCAWAKGRSAWTRRAG